MKICYSPIFASTRLLARPVGPIKINMINPEITEDNIAHVTEEQLQGINKEEFDKAVAEYKKQCLAAFSTNRSGDVIKKHDFPERHVVIQQNPGMMQNAINEAVHQAMINQASVMTNTVHNAVLASLNAQGEQGFKGPAYHLPGVMDANSATPRADFKLPVVQPMADLGTSEIKTSVPLTSAVASFPNTTPIQTGTGANVLGWDPATGFGMSPGSFHARNTGKEKIGESSSFAPYAGSQLPMTAPTQPMMTSSVPFVTYPVSQPVPYQQFGSATQPINYQPWRTAAVSEYYQPQIVAQPTNMQWGTQGTHGLRNQFQSAPHQNPVFERPVVQPFQSASFVDTRGPGSAVVHQHNPHMVVPQPTLLPPPVDRSSNQPTGPMDVQPMVQSPSGHQQIDLVNKITEVMQEQFGMKPKQQTCTYRTPYPSHFDYIPLPHRYKVPDFAKFSGQDDASSVEHVNRFLLQCGEAASRDELRVRLFSSSLSGSAFSWFTSLPPNSILTWADLEKQFHKYFFVGTHELKLTDLTKVRQRNDESVPNYIQRFRDVRSKCYSLVLSDSQLAELAFNGLLPHIKEKYAAQEFESLSQILHRISDQGPRQFDLRKNFPKKTNYVEVDGSDEEENQEAEVGLAEWVKTKKPISCPFGSKVPERFDFDVSKAERIFDLLLQEGQIKLSPNHNIPSADELKKIKYCKWHNATSHGTNECKVFRQQIQTAIKQGRLKFESPKKPPMKMDQHPFPSNIVDVGSSKVKVLTSESARRSSAVDPKAQVSIEDVKGKGRLKENRDYRMPQKRSATEALIGRYHRLNESRYEEEMQRHEDHWRCHFFIYCWEKELKLPTVDDCPECNGYPSRSRSPRR